MRMVNRAVINDKNVFIVCHRVKYTLFGEHETRFIDIATNLDSSPASAHALIPEAVVRNAEEAILVMNREYIDEMIPQDVIPFIVNSYTLISNTGEELCQQ